MTVSPATNEPKLDPPIVIVVPGVPEFALRFATLGTTVKGTALLWTAFTATTTFPLDAPAGTGTVMLVGLQLVGVACVTLKVTVLVPCDAPKFVPVIVTDAPTWAPPGVMLAMLGVGRTVKATPLLATPDTVTTTLPVVAPFGTRTKMLVSLQLLGLPTVPLKVTVLVPCVAPKLVPVIVTEFPTGAEVGERLMMFGVTVKATALLGEPPTVTMMFPVVAPDGTGTTILVALQLVGAPAIPLKVIVLVP